LYPFSTNTMISSIVLFFIITFSLGSALTFAGWNKEKLFEKIVITQGAGLLLIPIVGMAFNLLGVPLDYRNFLIAAAVVAAAAFVSFVRRRRAGHERATPLSAIKELFCLSNVLVLGIFAATLFMYLKGSFAYAWFEDGDPWRYAAAIKYIAVEKTYDAPFRFIEVGQPYPQAYQMILAIVSQINHSLNWSVKFFNSLIISLSLLYFYCLVRKITDNQRAGLLATAALASMPAWLSHFIFAINLSCVFLPLLIYMLIKIDENKRWSAAGAAAFAAVWLTHFSSAVAISLLFITYLLTKAFCENNLNRRLIIVGAAGFAASLFFWVPSLARFSEKAPGGLYLIMPYVQKIISEKTWAIGTLALILAVAALLVTEKRWCGALVCLAHKTKTRNLKPKLFALALVALMALLLCPHKFMGLRGSGSIAYEPNHFFLFERKANFIQNPYGIGPLAMVVSLCALGYCLFHIKNLFSPGNKFRAIIVTFWFFSFLAVNGAHFSLNIMPFRMWAYFAFAVGLSIGLFYLDFIDKKLAAHILRLPVSLILIMCFIPTWHAFKFSLNSTMWRESYINVIQAQEFLSWTKNNLPADSKVYTYGVSQVIPIVYDMVSYVWDREVDEYQFNDTGASLEHNYQFLKSKGYDYVLIDESLIFSHRLSRTYFAVPKDEVMKNFFLARQRIRQLLNVPDKFQLIKKYKETGYLFQLL